jgi:DNA-entry nuclease
MIWETFRLKHTYHRYHKRKKSRAKRCLLILLLTVGLCLAVFWGIAKDRPFFHDVSDSLTYFMEQLVFENPQLHAVSGSAAGPVVEVAEVTTNKLPEGFDYSAIPPYSGSPVVDVNGSKPFFKDADLTDQVFESYSPLDELGRCGTAFACLNKSMMPEGERPDISSIHPSGWFQEMYDGIDGSYLYNRCHLIGYQMTGQGANPLDLITGTRYMNTEGMLANEDSVAMYLREYPSYHVLYRVTPVFEGDNLLASGVLMEAQSVEDSGVYFCQFAYNVQPGIYIDYADGHSRQA